MTPGSVIKCLGGSGGLFVLLGVLLVHVGFFFRTLRRRLPIAAEFVFEQVEGGEVGPFCAGKFLDHQLHPLLIDLAAHVGVALAGRRASHHIVTIHLPADVGGAIQAFGGKRGCGKQIVNAIVETHGVLSGVAAAAAAAGFVFGIGGLTEDDFVAVGSVLADECFGQNPSRNGFALGFLVVIALVFGGFAQDGLDVRPVAVAVDDDEFVAASSGAKFCGIGTGRNADGFFVHQSAALGLGER